MSTAGMCHVSHPTTTVCASTSNGHPALALVARAAHSKYPSNGLDHTCGRPTHASLDGAARRGGAEALGAAGAADARAAARAARLEREVSARWAARVVRPGRERGQERLWRQCHALLPGAREVHRAPRGDEGRPSCVQLGHLRRSERAARPRARGAVSDAAARVAVRQGPPRLRRGARGADWSEETGGVKRRASGHTGGAPAARTTAASARSRRRRPSARSPLARVCSAAAPAHNPPRCAPTQEEHLQSRALRADTRGRAARAPGRRAAATARVATAEPRVPRPRSATGCGGCARPCARPSSSSAEPGCLQTCAAAVSVVPILHASSIACSASAGGTCACVWLPPRWSPCR